MFLVPYSSTMMVENWHPYRERAYHLAEWFFVKLDCRNVPIFPIRTPRQASVNIGFISELPLLITCVISIILPLIIFRLELMLYVAIIIVKIKVINRLIRGRHNTPIHLTFFHTVETVLSFCFHKYNFMLLFLIIYTRTCMCEKVLRYYNSL